MRIHEVLLVPTVGHTSDEGLYTRGHDTGSLAEVDLVDQYISYMVDELDNEGIRHRVLGTRRAPGIKESERATSIPVNTLVIHCCMGWHANHKKFVLEHNVSKVFYGLQDAIPLATELSEIIGQWGDIYVFGHRTGKPLACEKDTLLKAPQCTGIRLEPFLINGPHAIEYAAKLPKLGKDMGRCISNYCRLKGQGQAAKPSTLTF